MIAIQASLAWCDLTTLTAIARDLKAAVGGYGVTAVTEKAGSLEQAAATRADLKATEGIVLELANPCEEVRQAKTPSQIHS